MEDVIKEKLCNFCTNNKSENCMNIKTNIQKEVICYMCQNYNKKEEGYQKFAEYIKYTFYSDIGEYVAIIRKETPKEKIQEIKMYFDEVKYQE